MQCAFSSVWPRQDFSLACCFISPIGFRGRCLLATRRISRLPFHFLLLLADRSLVSFWDLTASRAFTAGNGCFSSKECPPFSLLSLFSNSCRTVRSMPHGSPLARNNRLPFIC